MFNIVLFQPEIPANTGNLIRLAANTGCHLHLIAPLGFSLDEKSVRRSGLDYHELADLTVHENWQSAREVLKTAKWYAFTTKASTIYTQAHFQAGDVLLFGPETRGLPGDVLAEFDTTSKLKLPMRPGNRSMNLANSVSATVFEAWRQNGFSGA